MALSRAGASKEAYEIWNQDTADAHGKHGESVQMAYDALMRLVPAFTSGSSKNLDVLEIGCGTGLLSFKLAPHVRSLIGVDISPGLLDEFDKKVAKLPDPLKANLAAINVLVQEPDDVHLQSAASALAIRRGESGNDKPYRFDLIVSHLALHHVPDIATVIKTLYKCLKPGGWVALMDYEDFGPDAIPFHPKDMRDNVCRHGIKKDELSTILNDTGFSAVKVEQAFVLRKDVEAEGGKPAREMDFPFLLCLGKHS